MWGAWGFLSLWRNQIHSLEADFLRPSGNNVLFDGFGNFSWYCAKGKDTDNWMLVQCWHLFALCGVSASVIRSDQHMKHGVLCTVSPMSSSPTAVGMLSIWIFSSWAYISKWSKPICHLLSQSMICTRKFSVWFTVGWKGTSGPFPLDLCLL